MARMTLEEMTKRYAKRRAAFEQKQINRDQIKTALINYLNPLPLFSGKEIIDIDIPALTTELVDIKIYTKDYSG